MTEPVTVTVTVTVRGRQAAEAALTTFICLIVSKRLLGQAHEDVCRGLADHFFSSPIHRWR